MEDIFIKLLNMSITASYFAVAVILMRIIFRKIPKWISCILWGLVGIRLVFPFSFESILSLIPSTETVPEDIIFSSTPHISSGIPAFNSTINPIINESFAPGIYESANPLQIVMFILSALWITGVMAMLIYASASYIILRKKTAISLKTEKGVFICDNIDSPFILGLIKPSVFIPSYINEDDISFILAHEKAHIKRLDYIWKPLGFLILSIYWFNPVLWVCYVLLCRDIEAACDEKVIRSTGYDIKKAYSNALLNCSSPRKLISACPLAFGENDIKARIRNILSYKKPTLWIIIITVLISIILSVCFMTNPAGMKLNNIEGYSDMLDSVDKIQLFIGNGHVFTTEDTKHELSQIKKVRVDRKPLTDITDSIVIDNPYRIEINDRITININGSFSQLYLTKESDGTTISSDRYTVRNPDVLKHLFSENNQVTDMHGIYVSIEEIAESESGLYFNAIWHNERETDVEYGEVYTLERLTAEKIYEDVPFPENFVFLMPAYLLKSGTTAEKSYYCPMKLSDGEYRFTTTFRTTDGKSYEAKTIFFIGNNSADGTENTETTTLLLSLDEVIRLSEKGMELSWSDFDNFAYVETGSGLYIRSYEMDGSFSLTIGGSDTDSKPMYIYLHSPDSSAGEFIDIRFEDIGSFISDHKNDPAIKNIACLQKGFPVDNTGSNFQSFIDYGCYIPKSADNIQYLPTIKIETMNDLDAFINYFDETFKMFASFHGENPSFIENCSGYKTDYDDFFRDYTVFITYAVTDSGDNFFEAGNANLYGDSLYLSFNEVRSEDVKSEDSIGWLIISEINKNDIQQIDRLYAFINTDTVDDSEPV